MGHEVFARHIVVLDFDASTLMWKYEIGQNFMESRAVGMGLVTTSSYEARKYGVRAGMPTFVAVKLCPQLISVPCNFEKYREASEHMKRVVLEYDSNPSMTSLDEIIFDLTDSAVGSFRKELPRSIDKDNPSGATLRPLVCTMVSEIREKIKILTGGLTSSAGIANNVSLAKIGSSVKIPMVNSTSNLSHCYSSFLRSLSLCSIPGVGRVFEKYLRECGFSTCGDVQNQLGICLYLFDRDKRSDFLFGACLGIAQNEGKKRSEDNDLPEKAVLRRTISCERTFSSVYTPAEVMHRLLRNTEKLANQMQEQRLEALAVSLKIKTAKYDVYSRTVTLSKYIQSAVDIEKAISPLFQAFVKDGIIPRDGVRLVGVSCSRFKGGLSRQEREGARLQPKMELFLKATSNASANKVLPPGEPGELGSITKTETIAKPENPGNTAENPVLLLSSQSDIEEEPFVDMDQRYHHSQSPPDSPCDGPPGPETELKEVSMTRLAHTSECKAQHYYDEDDEESEEDGFRDLRDMALASASMTAELAGKGLGVGR